MGILSRMGTLIKSNLNDVISKAEDPEKMLGQVLIDMQTQLVEAMKQVAVTAADEKRLLGQVCAEKSTVDDWDYRAVLAARANNEELMRLALARQQEHKDILMRYTQQWQQQKAAVDKLKEQLPALRNKIEEAKRKKKVLIARHKRAEAQRTIQATMEELSDTSALGVFSRMADQVGQIEAQAEAETELSEQLTNFTRDEGFKQIEAGSAGSDAALAALKARMGLDTPETAGALPPADTDRHLAHRHRQTES